MTCIESARYSLIASACVLAGLLVYSAGGRVLPQAHGGMVLTKGNLTFLTAKSANDEEALFVLVNDTAPPEIYTTSLRGRRGLVEPKVNRHLQQMFGTNEIGGGGRR